MQLIILGTGAAYPGEGQASAGFLLKNDDDTLLIDCGTGVLSNLFKWTEPADLNGIIISHLHTDHFVDLYPLRYYLQYTARINKPVKVFSPKGGADHISKIVSENSAEEFFQIFEFNEFKTGNFVDIKGFSIKFIPVHHSTGSYGVMVGKDRKLFYTGDTGFHEELIEEIHGAKTILSEATSQEKYRLLGPGHMTAHQAGLLAEQAGAERLILTHIWPSFDKNDSLKEASQVFKGEIIIAIEDNHYDI